jgi:CheY-like chemotaxis protein
MAALGTLAASVAHEVNNPLSVVLGNLDLLLSETKMGPAMRMEMLADVRDAAGRIRAIISDLRGLWQPPEPTPDGTASVERTIKWALEVTTHETRHFANVEAVVEPGMTVGISHVRLGQVQINRIRNAAQAIGPGYRGAVRVNARRIDERCIIRISDNGSGIPEELQARLFEPFFTTRGRDNGMGLGLYVSRRFVRGAGGDLEVYSKVGEGTTFTVTLPLVEVDRPLAKVVPITRQTTRRSDKILLVDDDPATVMALKRVLERSYEVVAATGGQAALDTLAGDQDFDVVLLDLMMPDLPGDQVYAEIRERFATLEPRVLLLTAGAISPAARDLVRRLGPRVLRKPLSATELLESVDRFLGVVD